MIHYDHLKVAAIPANIILADRSANIEAARRAIYSIPKDCDLAVLPELFSTGFIANIDEAMLVAEPNDGLTMRAMRQLAQERCMAICGSFLAKADDKLYNRAFFIEPNGDTTYYDKHHTFSISKESTVVQKGQSQIPSIRYRGWNIAICVCYDLRFPVWCRNCNLKYDLLVIPANWPDKREFAWTHLLQARAIENQAYVIGANRGGNDEFGNYVGLTYIFDYQGYSIGYTNNDIVYASLSKPQLTDYRESFPVWKDADNFFIID